MSNLHIPNTVSILGRINVKSFGASGSSSWNTGTINSGSTSLSLASAQDFQNGQGIAIAHAGAASSITTPTGLTATAVGTTGSTSYQYQIIAIDTNGGCSAASSVVSINNGAATLSSSNYVSLAWNSVSGVAYYVIYGRTSGSMVPLTITPVGSPSGTTFWDRGYGATGGWNVPPTPPATPLPQNFITTIVSGAGTTSLTLASAAAASVSNEKIVHDDSVSVQLAINAAISQGKKEVDFPPGSYFLLTNLTGTSSVSFAGDGVTFNYSSYSYPMSTVTGKPSKNQLVVNVTDYGAVSGGAWGTNSTAFANALAAANTVYVPAGTYTVSQIILTGGKRLIGDGVNATTIQLANSSSLTTYSQIGTKPGIIYIDDSPTSFQNEITIQGIKIDGNWNWASQGSILNPAHGIATWDSGLDDTPTNGRLNLRDVYIYNTPGDGIHIGSHGWEYTFNEVHVNQVYGHGIYMPRISDAIFTNIVVSMAMKSGITQGVYTDGQHGGNNKYTNIKIYFANSGVSRGHWPDNYPAMIVGGAIASLYGMDIQQNLGDGLVLCGHMITANGLLIDSNGSSYKTDSANLRISSGCKFSRITGIISGNRFTSPSTGSIRSKYGIIIENGNIGYNKYDFIVNEMDYVQQTTEAYAEGYYMIPYSYTINDPTSSLMINGREMLTNPSTIIPAIVLGGTNTFIGLPTVTGSSGSFNIAIPSGQDSTTVRSNSVSFTINPASGTDNQSTANYYNTSLASAKYMIIWFRCQSDFPIQLSVSSTNKYSGGNDPLSTNTRIRNVNYSSTYRDMMIYVPVNTTSGATTNVVTTITFTLPQGVTVTNRVYNLTIDNLKYCLV